MEKENQAKAYKAAIFDLDGTLLDTLTDLWAATNHVLQQFGYPARSLDEVRRFVGNGAARLIELALPQGRENRQFNAVLDYFKTYYAQNCQGETRPYDGILPMLAVLREQGLQLAVVSNKPHAAVVALNESFFGSCIPVAIGEREGIRRKPAPDSVFQALRELGRRTEEAVYIGDSDVDICTAANAGMDCISVSWGFRSADFLRRHGASCIVDSPAALQRLLLNAK